MNERKDEKDDGPASETASSPHQAPLVLTPPPGDSLKTPAPPQPAVYQQPPGIPLAGFPGAIASQTFALSVTNAEMEVIKKVTPEHISQEMQNRHERDMRRIGLQEKEMEAEQLNAKDDLTRDERDRQDLQRTDGRLERMFYIVLAAVIIICMTFTLKGQVDLAVKVIEGFVAVLVALLGGIGVESLRKARKDRSRRRREEADPQD